MLRLLVACTFIFSGVVKLTDPHGTEYKIQDYYSVLSFHVSPPDELALFLAVLLGVCEFLMGLYLLFGIRRRMTMSATILFMLLVTPFTLWLAIANPISDCGCFGDAIKLSNWQTFAKNVVLLISSVVLSWRYKQMTRFISEQSQWTVSLYSWVFAIAFASYNLYALPVMDFRPYHIGANLLHQYQESTINDAEFVTTFILEKNGEQREFTLEDYPDSTWTFIDSKTEQISGVSITGHSIAELQVTSVETGQDMLLNILEYPGYSFLLVAPYLEKADDGVMDQLNAIYEYSLEHNYPFYCLTSSSDENIERWRDMTGAEYPFCHTDAVELKAMVRSNPGLILLHEGVVVNKWPCTMLPQRKDLVAPIEASHISYVHESSYIERIVRILLWYLIPLLLFTFADGL